MEKLLRINEKQLAGDTLTETIIAEKDRVLYRDLQKQKSGPSTRRTIAENLKNRWELVRHFKEVNLGVQGCKTG